MSDECFRSLTGAAILGTSFLRGGCCTGRSLTWIGGGARGAVTAFFFSCCVLVGSGALGTEGGDAAGVGAAAAVIGIATVGCGTGTGSSGIGVGVDDSDDAFFVSVSTTDVVLITSSGTDTFSLSTVSGSGTGGDGAGVQTGETGSTGAFLMGFSFCISGFDSLCFTSATVTFLAGPTCTVGLRGSLIIIVVGGTTPFWEVNPVEAAGTLTLTDGEGTGSVLDGSESGVGAVAGVGVTDLGGVGGGDSLASLTTSTSGWGTGSSGLGRFLGLW